MKTRVLDSWAILEWINGGRTAGTRVAALLAEAESGQARLLMSAINVGEVYYFLRKRHSSALAESWRESCIAYP
jgi:predicted nucleic acid-binding protein